MTAPIFFSSCLWK